MATTKRSTQLTALAKGGTTKMFGKQAAGPDKPGNLARIGLWHRVRSLRAAAKRRWPPSRQHSKHGQVEPARASSRLQSALTVINFRPLGNHVHGLHFKPVRSGAASRRQR
jgi:hypothetical protein